MTANRPWDGELYRVALYNRALTDGEITENFEKSSHGTAFPAVTRDLVGCFDFREQAGDAAHDHSPTGTGGTLVSARFLTFGETLLYHFQHRFFTQDMAFNVLGFIPLAVLVHLNAPGLRRTGMWGLYGLPAAIGFSISLTIEYVQRHTMIRNANLWDIIYNVVGTLLGALLFHALMRWQGARLGNDEPLSQ